MQIIRKIKDLRRVIGSLKSKRRSIGFVPTMGSLHEGHLSLIRAARKENQQVVVSIFVNPIQFGAKEDLKRYPRNFKKDLASCKKEGVDIIFYPDIKEMYPQGYKTYVTVQGLSDLLCGKFRPGHFQGVTTVVAKLFNLIQPDTAYFGQKDAQQVLIIQKMVQDLNMPVLVRVLPTVRELSGLAMSSRNIYLTVDKKRDALVLREALIKARELIGLGENDPKEVVRKMRQVINKNKAAKIQYISIVDLKELKPIGRIKDHALIALAVYIGRVRLIDNAIIFRDVLKRNLKVSRLLRRDTFALT
ncbi:pantoate--beta-alanine ligase [bacterium]|nr:MAG: pantoate--beta-alanine ligase [bacterium]